MKKITNHWLKLLTYEIRVLLAEILGGIHYRSKVRPKWLKRIIRRHFGWVIAVLALFGFSIKSIINFFTSQGFRTALDKYVSYMNKIPNTLGWFVGIIMLLMVSFIFIKIMISKKHLLAIATNRLQDKVEEKDRIIAEKENFEAETLLNEVINIGKRNKEAYDFLTNLWFLNIHSNISLSLLSIPGQVPPILRPIINVDIQHLHHNPSSPETLLNSIIRVQEFSRFEDFSGQESDYEICGGKPERFHVRNPNNRYLTRYKGPNKRETGFENDYTGYNASLRSMNFIDGKLILPIECTIELYGNIIDSSDLLINETYMHFAFDNYSTNIPPENVLSHMPWRKAIHRKYKNPIDILTQVKGRATGVGISALTVANIDGEYTSFIGNRSTKVGTFSNAYHVIPSGMANIDKGNSDLIQNGYLNLQLLFETEFMEEIFSYKKAVDRQTSFEPWAKIIKNQVHRNLYGEGNEYEAHIYLTGIVIDLLNYRPEICALILIKNRKWWDDKKPKLQFSVETNANNPTLQLSYEWLEKTININIMDDQAVLVGMPPDHSVPAGVAAFHLGVQKARELLS